MRRVIENDSANSDFSFFHVDSLGICLKMPTFVAVKLIINNTLL